MLPQNTDDIDKLPSFSPPTNSQSLHESNKPNPNMTKNINCPPPILSIPPPPTTSPETKSNKAGPPPAKKSRGWDGQQIPTPKASPATINPPILRNTQEDISRAN